MDDRSVREERERARGGGNTRDLEKLTRAVVTELCRNVTIYGSCKFEGKGCAFAHDPKKIVNAAPVMDNMKKSFNVDSPSFTPSFLAVTENGIANGKKPTGISPKAANAAPFLPKSTAVSRVDISAAPEWAMDVQEFIPQSYNPGHMANGSDTSSYEHFQNSSNPIPTQNNLNTQAPLYQDALSMGGAGFFPSQSGFQQPAQYHQYAPVGPYNHNLQSYQRIVHDLFIPNDLREEIQKKAAATLLTIPNLHLPAHIESYHSLVPLDTSQKSSIILSGYSSRIYKALSSTNGRFFALRRIEGFRLTNEKAIRTVQSWKAVTNSSIVQVHDAFTTRNFNDSSLIFVCDYHPMAKTLAEHHFGQNKILRGRNHPEQISEALLWTYVSQIASALKAIHSKGLAARVINLSKILLTGKNRIRLNACAILDVLQYDAQVPLAQLQRQDLVNFGLVVLSLGSNTLDAAQNFVKAMDQFNRHYGKELQAAVVWLYSAMQNQEKTIDQFLSIISSQLVTAFDAALQLDDQLYCEFGREVENARLFRLLAKLGFINERPEYEHDRQWSENGERYYLKLFRDYLFHQVDGQENPVIDLAHVLSCLNKLDAGSDERLTLVSRDNQSCFIVSYRELKKGIESAFQELSKNARRTH